MCHILFYFSEADESIGHILGSSWNFVSWISERLEGNIPQAMVVTVHSDDDYVVL